MRSVFDPIYFLKLWDSPWKLSSRLRTFTEVAGRKLTQENRVAIATAKCVSIAASLVCTVGVAVMYVHMVDRHIKVEPSESVVGRLALFLGLIVFYGLIASLAMMPLRVVMERIANELLFDSCAKCRYPIAGLVRIGGRVNVDVSHRRSDAAAVLCPECGYVSFKPLPSMQQEQGRAQEEEEDESDVSDCRRHSRARYAVLVSAALATGWVPTGCLWLLMPLPVCVLCAGLYVLNGKGPRL